MDWSKTIQEHVSDIKPTLNEATRARIFSMLDATRLIDEDTEANMAVFLEKIVNAIHPVAAVCVYPQYVALATATLKHKQIPVASVANFPTGKSSLEDVLIEMNTALQNGAHEIDVVFPYERYLAGDVEYAKSFIIACKTALGEHGLLKVILETGALKTHKNIANACRDVLESGADFVKTSTGRNFAGATLEDVTILLMIVKEMASDPAHRKGVKVSGGIQTLEQAAQFIELADRIMGKSWIGPKTFRIGSSKLLG